MGKLIRVLAVVILLATAKGACADEFSFSFSSGPNSASGTLTATPSLGPSFLVTSLSATLDLSGTDFAMALLSPGTYGVNDNLIYPLAPVTLDAFGVGFTADSLDFDIYFDILTMKYMLCNSADSPTCNLGDGSKVSLGSLTPIVGAMPEPSAAILLILGFAGSVALSRKPTASSTALC